MKAFTLYWWQKKAGCNHCSIIIPAEKVIVLTKSSASIVPFIGPMICMPTLQRLQSSYKILAQHNNYMTITEKLLGEEKLYAYYLKYR